MTEEIRALQAEISRSLPAREGVSIAASAIDVGVDSLYPEEYALVERAVEKRQAEFATARSLARRSMRELGLPVGPILRGDQREPIWPAGILGSMTHADGCAVACVARPGAVRSVGIDVELAERVGKDLWGKLFTKAELRFLAGKEAGYAGLLFSAKEAVYKATFPLVGRFIGFQEAELSVDEARSRIEFRYVGEHAANQVMEEADCHYLFSPPYVLCLVIVPAP
jgi:4'-phosphopantetheinyl transferase EntD